MLQNYVALNFTACVKILKKFDKRFCTGLRSEYVRAIGQLPFYRCQSLGGLVEEAEQQFQRLEVVPHSNLPPKPPTLPPLSRQPLRVATMHAVAGRLPSRARAAAAAAAGAAAARAAAAAAASSAA